MFLAFYGYIKGQIVGGCIETHDAPLPRDVQTMRTALIARGGYSIKYIPFSSSPTRSK